MYDSQITFTLDTICPWTFVAKKRLDKALEQFRASPDASKASFTMHFDPYQLYPDAVETDDKRAWYLRTKHNDNPDAQLLFIAHMNTLIEPLGLEFNFDGPIGNTFAAHRVIQHFQEDKGGDTADRLVNALYRRYFQEAKHPASEETLVDSCVEAGIDEKTARGVVVDKDEGRLQAKQRINAVSMDVDAVPIVTFEGKRRDITLTGAKEIEDYVKAMQSIVKESS